jgi:subtilisin family serine protease
MQISVSFAALTFVSLATTVVKAEHAQPYAIPDRYIVVLKRGHSKEDVARGHGLRPHFSYSRVLHGFATTVPPGRLHALKNDPRIELVEEDLELFVSGQTMPTGVKRIGTALSPMANINGLDERVNVDIAILDTGIAPHPDLNLFNSVSFVAGQTTDGNGHGTHVAGIAAALDNGWGVVGVAPGARLWAVKILDDTGAGATSTLIQGIDYVTQNAAQIEVANMSLAGIGYSAALRQAIINSVAKGVVFVVSAGNDSRDIYGPDGVLYSGDDSIPAAYPEVAAVSALSDLDGIASGDDALADFSNFSRNLAVGNPVFSSGAAIDLAAPGVNIYSTYLGGGYTTMSGSSMAAPHVAGAAALYVAANGRATSAAGVAAVRQALINMAQSQTAWGSLNSADPDANREGLVNVAAIAPPLNNPPSVSISSPASGAAFTAPANVTIYANASDTDGTVTKVEFFAGSTLIGTDTLAPYSINWSNVPAGTYSLTARATDNAGATKTSTSVSITVSNPANIAPTVGITSPVTGAGFTAPANVTIYANASDSDGTITKVDFFAGSTLIGTDTTAPYSIVWIGVPAGTYSLTARATDNAGAAKTSTAVSITVSSPINNPPTVAITSPANGASFNSGSAVLFTGAANDAEDGDRTASLVWTSSLDGQIGTGGSFSKVLRIGTHTITARATDSVGNSTTRSITVTIVSALRVSVTTKSAIYFNRSTAYITATVTDGLNPVSGAAAHLQIRTPKGRLVQKDAVTDSYGIARFQYMIDAKWEGYGTCTATVSCSKPGSISGSGSVSYTVTR